MPAPEGHVRFGEFGIDGKRVLEQSADPAGQTPAKRRKRAYCQRISANGVRGLVIRFLIG